jgi:pseudouridine-5'-phosphate glycosidase
VVALESTIIAHGFPAPDNLALAGHLEESVRKAGAVPATIGILGGVAHVGLGREAVERLADPDIPTGKANAADMAAFMASRRDAATTVSATATLAARVGIRVFATGGIGGVHRGFVGDVSNDITTLGNTPIAVISSGAKAILDLPRTLEALETAGVMVVGYRTRELPSFYSPESGLALEHWVDNPAQAARLLQVRFDELRQGGILIANPIPPGAQLPFERMSAVIETALADAKLEGVVGKALTPYLLSRIAAVTGGDSVKANRALAISNARVAGEIAAVYSGTQ